MNHHASTLSDPTRLLPITLVTCAILAGCGGGGGDDEPVAALPACQAPSQATTTIVQSLNQFWQRNLKLCLAEGGEGTWDKTKDEYRIDPKLLNGVINTYSAAALVGVLAVEWADYSLGERDTLGANLQEICLAGAYLRAATLSNADFARLAGDLDDEPTLGTRTQRTQAATRGYATYRTGQTQQYVLTTVCPNNATSY